MADLSARTLNICGGIVTMTGFGFCYLTGAWSYWFAIPAFSLLIYGAVLRAMADEAPE